MRKNAEKMRKNAGKNSSNIEKLRRYRHRGEGTRWEKKTQVPSWCKFTAEKYKSHLNELFW